MISTPSSAKLLINLDHPSACAPQPHPVFPLPLSLFLLSSSYSTIIFIQGKKKFLSSLLVSLRFLTTSFNATLTTSSSSKLFLLYNCIITMASSLLSSPTVLPLVLHSTHSHPAVAIRSPTIFPSTRPHHIELPVPPHLLNREIILLL